MVLASEPICICGIDVAAPQQIRRSQQEPLESFFAHFQQQFTPAEVRQPPGAVLMWRMQELTNLPCRC